jgi:hypothetical protein
VIEHLPRKHKAPSSKPQYCQEKAGGEQMGSDCDELGFFVK